MGKLKGHVRILDWRPNRYGFGSCVGAPFWLVLMGNEEADNLLGVAEKARQTSLPIYKVVFAWRFPVCLLRGRIVFRDCEF